MLYIFYIIYWSCKIENVIHKTVLSSQLNNLCDNVVLHSNDLSNVKEKRTREVLDLLNESLGELIFESDEKGKINRNCKLCNTGQLSLKNSFRGGAFIGCSNYPECKFTRPLSKSKANDQIALAEPKLIGQNDTGQDIFLKNGRFGPYLQYEMTEDENISKKRKRKKKMKI